MQIPVPCGMQAAMRPKGTAVELERRRRRAMRLLESGHSLATGARMVGAAARRTAGMGSGTEAPPLKKSPAPERVPRFPRRERVSLAANGAPDVGPAGRDTAPSSSLSARQGVGDLRAHREPAAAPLRALRALPLRQYLAGRSRPLPPTPAPPLGRADHRALGWRRDSRRARGRASPRPPSAAPRPT